MISISSLFENSPEHPNTIIIKNEFYPNGLTQQQVYDYYMSHKTDLLKSVDDREIIIFFSTDTNKFIVKRRDSNGGFFKLTYQNYDNVISGRTVSIHSTMNQKESFGIIDIDTINFNKAKDVTSEVYDHLIKDNKEISIRFTGKTGFHIVYNFKKELNIDDIKKSLQSLLEPFAKKYHIGTGNRSNVGIDLSSNKFRGGFISLYSLSILGLKCMEINRKDIEKFEKKSTVI